MEKKEKKKLTGGEFALLIGNFLWMLAVYFGCIYLLERFGVILPYQICTGVYCAAAIILPVVSGVLSGKFVSKKTGEARTDAQIALSRRLVLWAIPLIAVLLIDIIDLFVVEYFKQLLSVSR
ncbi:MAG: hypothetical protein E7647_03495 [Ruminococcaceae bacterium]|nr:hypothetical protein [Oscillospiraceae bacterium]